MASMVKALLILVVAAAGLYGAALAWLWWKQEALLFFPEPLAPSHRLSTDADVHEVTVPVEGAALSVLHLRLPAPKGVVFFLHGNAGNLASWFINADFYRQANFDLVMVDYRGYGKSTGRITSPEQLRSDVRAAWNRFGPAYAGKRVVVFGRSLGTALASDLARQLTAEGQPPALTVLVSPYTSLRALTAEFYPWVPSALLRYPLDTAAHLPAVGGPVLLLHGDRDELIRPSHSEALHRVVPGSRLLVVPGAGHNDIHTFPVYRQALQQALTQL